LKSIEIEQLVKAKELVKKVKIDKMKMEQKRLQRLKSSLDKQVFQLQLREQERSR